MTSTGSPSSLCSGNFPSRPHPSSKIPTQLASTQESLTYCQSHSQTSLPTVQTKWRDHLTLLWMPASRPWTEIPKAAIQPQDSTQREPCWSAYVPATLARPTGIQARHVNWGSAWLLPWPLPTTIPSPTSYWMGPTLLQTHIHLVVTPNHHQQPVQTQWQCILCPSNWHHMGIHFDCWKQWNNHLHSISIAIPDYLVLAEQVC